MDAKPVRREISFSEEKMKKNSLFDSPYLFYDAYCLLPGQGQKVHAHEGSDKIYYVLEGTGRFTIGDEEEDLGEGHTVYDPNVGGKVELDWGSVRVVPAWHTSTTPKGTVNTPAGLVVELGGARVYHLGDTALFSDLQLVKRYGRIDVAIMPIGGHYTMDRFDAVVAAEWVGADTIIPCHYGTFPPIETDAEAFRSDVQNAGAGEVVVMNPGDMHST